MSNNIIETPVPLSNIEGGGVITDIDTKIGTVDDEATGSVLGKLNYLMENIGKGGLKKVVLEDGEFIGQHVYDITPYYPTLAFIHIKMNTVISDTSGTAEGKLDIVMYPPFNRSYRYIYKDGEYVSEDVIRYRVNSTRKLYYYPYVGTMTSSDLQIILLLQGTLKDSTENEYYLYSGTTATVELYYFDSTPVDSE